MQRLNAFRVLLECMGAFGRLGRLGKHNPIWYGMYVWYVCTYGKHNCIKQRFIGILKGRSAPSIDGLVLGVCHWLPVGARMVFINGK